jgi:hypothetical protein
VAEGVSIEGLPRLDSGPGERLSRGEALGLLGSALLHGLALVLLLLAAPLGVPGSRGDIELVPVEVELPSAEPQAHAEPQQTDLNRSDATQALPSNSSASPAGQAADPLEAKLQALAKLRQPDADRRMDVKASLSTADDAAPGRLAALKDFVRDQVERHWSLNLASLGENEFSIPIRIQITSSGTVLKAEIMDTARDADPVYHEVASSARNAVLSASPLTLPAGHYQNVMELVLSLDPRETLR